jgi:hypothetical protein
MNHSLAEMGGVQTAVVLPCSPDQFSEFVASLLGRPQELTGGREGQFLANKAEALQLHHLITQRVDQQNGVKPLQFTARIAFENGTSVLLNTLDDFNSYNEVRALRSTALHMTWTFVISFPGRQIPEKQEIEFGFVAERQSRIQIGTMITTPGEGYVYYRIRHTARTWGADMEGLLTHYMDSLIRQPSRFRSVLRKYSGWVGMSFGAIVFALLMGGLGVVSARVLDQNNALLVPVIGDGVSASTKLDHILVYLSVARESLRSFYTSLYMITSVVISVASGIWVGAQAESVPPSDVVFSRRAEDVHKTRKREYETSLRRLVLTVCGTFVLGLAVNTVYDFLLKSAIERSMQDSAQLTNPTNMKAAR